MVNNILKSSVSILVLISFISSIHPSHAGNAGNGGEKGPERKGIPVSRQQQDISLNFQEVAQSPERTLAVLYEKTGQEDLQNLRISLVLKKEGVSLRLDQGIYSIPLLLDLRPDILIKFRSVSKSWDAFWHTFICQQYNLVKNNTIYDSSFIKVCIGFDPLKDCKEIEFAQEIINTSANHQVCILCVAKTTTFDVPNFPDLVNNPENFIKIQRHLKAINYIGKSNHESADLARGKQNNFSIMIKYYFCSIIEELNSKHADKFFKNSNFLDQPFWSVYTNDRTAVKRQIEIIDLISNTSFSLQLNAEKIESFWNFVKIYYPEIESLRRLYKEITPSNLDRITEQIVEPLLAENKYNEVMNILEHCPLSIRQSPFRFQILYNTAKHILFSDTQQLFPLAKQYNDILLEEFNNQQTDVISTLWKDELPKTLWKDNLPNVTNSASFFDLSTQRETDILYKKQVNSLVLGFSLFDKATDCIKRDIEFFEPGEIFYGEFSEPILKTLKMCMKPAFALPKDLKNLLVQKAEKGFSLSFFKTEQGKQRLANYGNVFKYFLKDYFTWHPLEKREFKQLQKKTLKSEK